MDLIKMDKYLSFKGCSTRSEYWAVMCVSTLIGFLWFLSIGLFLAEIDDSAFDVPGGFVIIAGWTVIVWAQFATVIRRCRDAGISPWFTATICIPYIGIIPWVIIGCLETSNKE